MGTMKSKFVRISFATLCVITLASCGRASRKKSVPNPSDKIFTVSAARVKSQEIPDVLQQQGVFIPVHRLELKSDFTGRIQTLSVVEGQSVLTGDALLKIEDELLPFVQDRQRAELREAEAQLELSSRQESEPTEAAGDALEEESEENLDTQVPPSGETGTQNFSEENSPPPQEDQNNVDESNPFDNNAQAPEALGEGDNQNEEPTDNQDQSQDDTMARLAQLRRRAQMARQNTLRRRNGPQAAQAPQENPAVTESRRQLDQAKVDRIRAELSLTEKQLEGSTLIAPFDGFVSRVPINEGSMVKPGELLMEIVSLDPIELSLKIPQQAIAQINKQMEVKVTVPALGPVSFKGSLSYIGAEVSGTDKSIEIRVQVENREGKIKIGMDGTAQMAEAKASHRALLIPQEAILREENKTYVYVIEGQVAQKQEVSLGAFFNNEVEIKRGLGEDDSVVTRGIDQLSEEEEFIKVSNL